MRWGIKGMGLLSTLVLARVLTPGDYGVVAMAMLVVGLAEVLIDFGSTTALLREPNAESRLHRLGLDARPYSRGDRRRAAGRGCTTCRHLFKEPRVVAVIWMIAPFIAFAGLGNIGITLARKQLNFALEFRYMLAGKLVGVLVTVAAALLLRDYRALIIGVAAGYFAGMVLSYAMHRTGRAGARRSSVRCGISANGC